MTRFNMFYRRGGSPRLTSPVRLAAIAGALSALIAVALSGCGGKTVAPKALVPLTLKSQAVGGNAVRALAPAAPTALAGAASTQDVEVTFTRALLVIRDVRFKLDDGIADGDSLGDDDLGEAAADGDSVDSDEGDGDGGGMVLFRGPFVVDLVAHQSAALDTELVPPGDYRRVQGHLRALHEGDPGAGGDLSFLVGSTVFLEGTIAGDGGGPFTYQARIDDEFQIRGQFTVAASTPATGFLTFDLSKWLVDREGRFLDPRIADNDQAIRSAIRHSIKVWMDRDHNGELDDADRGGE
jgi:hypothetical protein